MKLCLKMGSKGEGRNAAIQVTGDGVHGPLSIMIHFMRSRIAIPSCSLQQLESTVRSPTCTRHHRRTPAFSMSGLAYGTYGASTALTVIGLCKAASSFPEGDSPADQV